ncbi:neutral/alkaline non-lysosomal ceramidase N-terminal domain-containing protein [Runella sp.]|uniref:neutral/alkaline non-lysosomal ceramidase N-terminal domain-containing protein n=1 Tax=Runella sp. TaxID=1960881 RepID=UPI003D14975D
MRFLKILLKVLGGLVLLIVVILACMLTTVDDTPYQEMAYYKEWKSQIKALSIPGSQVPQAPIDNEQSPQAPPREISRFPLNVGWAKVNFTPRSPTPTAGYGVRKGALYKSVHDSIYVRAVVIENGTAKAAIVAADLLIIPPAVTEQLKTKLKATGIPFEQVYLGATHSHNSMGGWSEGIVGKLFGGEFNEANVTWIADAIVKAVQLAQRNVKPAAIAYHEIADTARVRNRAFDDGTIDPYLRTLQFVREDGQKALLCSYAAHSTITSSDNIVLSRDYPGVLVDSLEHGEANFALFMSGAVGSMGPKIEAETDLMQVVAEADSLESDVQKQLKMMQTFQNPAFQMVTLPLPLRHPVPRISTGLSMRPWVFRWAFGDYPNYVKAMRIGNVLMVGFPCDFSGELVAEMSAYAEKKGLKLMVTSFNGGYIGYVTPDKYYGKDGYETMTMNWFGPYNGAYFQEIARDLIDKMS